MFRYSNNSTVHRFFVVVATACYLSGSSVIYALYLIYMLIDMIGYSILIDMIEFVVELVIYVINTIMNMILNHD